MKRSIEDTPIVFIGAGNLATNLAKALYRKGFRIEVGGQAVLEDK